MSAPSLPSVHAAPRLVRLYDPACSRPIDLPADRPLARCSPQMRLNQFVEAYFIPVPCRAKGLAKVTIEMYRVVASYWSELTKDRPLEEIGVDDGADFLEGLRLQPGLSDEFMSPATVKRHATNLQRILDVAGPRSRHGKWGRYGVGLVDQVPFIEPPEVPDKLPDGDFTHEEVLTILAASSLGRVHDDYPGDAEQFWRSLVTFLCGTGLRIYETMGLEWTMIDRQLLLIPGALAKTKRSRVKYLHPSILAAIEPLRGIGRRIFAWPGWPAAGAVRWLQRRREQLLIAAGIPEHRRFGFHGFRKYHATELFDIEQGAKAAQASLGHGDEGVTTGFYVNGGRQRIAEIELQRTAIDQMRLFG